MLDNHLLERDREPESAHRHLRNGELVRKNLAKKGQEVVGLFQGRRTQDTTHEFKMYLNQTDRDGG